MKMTISQISTRIKFFLLLVMMVATTLLAINNYNAGVYADKYGLDGASVGWFAPNGMLIFFLTGLMTFLYGVYLLNRFLKK